MHILIVSWRDIKNPHAGGAEILTHAIAKRLVKKGHQVTIISGGFTHQPSNHTAIQPYSHTVTKPSGQRASTSDNNPSVSLTAEIIDGIHILRPTHFHPTNFTGYLHWPLFLLKTAQTIKKIERQLQTTNYKLLVIDQIHGLPSFITLCTKKPVIFFPLEIADEIWNYEVPFPGNLIGKALENFYLKLFKNHPFLAISRSEAKDLKQHGVTNVSIINPGIDPPPKNLTKKTKHPIFAALGRITPMKRLEDTITAFSLFHKQYPQSQLHIIGKGKQNYTNKLKEKIASLNLKGNIRFHGFLPGKQKYQLLAQSWALLSTSVKEGFGLNVIEAASVGTPTIAYRISGIIDTVKNNQTGLLTSQNNPQTLASLMLKLTKDTRLRSRLGKLAKQHSHQFTWDKTTREFIRAIKKATT